MWIQSEEAFPGISSWMKTLSLQPEPGIINQILVRSQQALWMKNKR